jgi:hypothetical protein
MSEHIKKLAEQAGMEWDTHIWCWLANPPHLEKFAELVRQNEREICADLVFKMAQLPEFDAAWVVLHEAQSAIRVRGEK